MGEEQKKTEVEIQRLDEFVKQAPIGDYNIDQEKQRICHQLGSGQEKCVQLNLEGMVLFYSYGRKGKSMLPSMVPFWWRIATWSTVMGVDSLKWDQTGSS
ncbi:hypothetical protein INT44_005344 [Umbelopsis vinacea]|uniref:Uncharacterized protein n=1 Tax=Umbelopsis vinacea TaxID=44442 RepID=A0A8H7Q9F4_9FUNG|nr:hypothetical protein INT44_005344 [Umbelopsis vinacea]